jgi:signal transduction histidine kinase
MLARLWREWLRLSSLTTSIGSILVATLFVAHLAFAANDLGRAADDGGAPAVLHLQQAEFVAGESVKPPAQGWTSVTLPDRWRRSHPGLSGFAWYRLRFSLAQPPSRPLALYVKHISMAGEFWLNGSLLNPGVRFDSPNGHMGSDMGDEPHLIILPAGLFHAGDNELNIKLQGDRRIRSGVSEVLLGPLTTFQSDWRWRYTIQVVVPYIVLVVMAGAGCFVIAHLWRRRQPHLIQLCAVIATISVIIYLSASMPISRVDLQVVRVFVTTIMFWVLCVIGYRMARIPVRGFWIAQHGLPILVTVVVLVLWISRTATDQIWFVDWPLLVLRTFVVGLVLWRAWLDRSIKLALLAISAQIWLVAVAQSVAISSGWLPWDSVLLSTVGNGPFCLMLLFLFAEQFILDHEQAKEQQRAAIMAERGRILQDMHDGMGAHLITALRLARREDVDRVDLARSLEESLQDLRLIIDSLDLSGRDLLPLLGNLRFRLEPRLNALGIRLEWDAEPPLPELEYLTPESALAILRIVQEAINNAIQHAQATLLRLTVRSEGEQVLVEVSDNGTGFVPRAGKGARGLSGMRMRAAKLGADLAITSNVDGTKVGLRLLVEPD